MFDMATRPQANTASAAAVFGVPFDWRLLRPEAVADYPYTDFCEASTGPVVGVEALATFALALEDTLQTAIILSLFTDGRAGRDDKLPLNETDRRGWVGEEFLSGGVDATTDPWGSRLWLCYSGKVSGSVLEAARFAAQQALEWLVRDGVAERVLVTAEWVGVGQDRLAVRPAIYKPGQVRPVYDVLWGTSIKRLAQ